MAMNKPKKRLIASVPLAPPKGGVSIRMYRQGLGDCFLLAFHRSNKDPVYMLIDCGAHAAQTGGREVMEEVVEDIIATTNGQLDIVVATHEHADHLSAFKHHAEAFLQNRLRIGELWLAWTEDDNDPTAKRLRRGRTAAKRAIGKALDELKKKAARSRSAVALSQRIAAFESFFNIDAGGPLDSRLAGRLGLKDPDKVSGPALALALLKECAVDKPVSYFRPGHGPHPILGSASARAYILGPPLDDALLRKSDPSAGNRKETYLSSVANALSFAAIGIENDTTDYEDKNSREMCFPFDVGYRINQSDTFYAQFYGLDDTAHPNWWRQIEEEWLSAAEELALHLDNHTNNTSLVLAIEVGTPGEGPVLFFAADAQVGSWLSWRDLNWRVGQQSVSITDLLKRTVVYKVGHHASHNATLRRDSQGQDYGLELMQDGCIALIPVDQACAKKLEWGMPHPKLYAALKRKTHGNILRSDNGHDPDVATTRVRYAAVPGLNCARWRCSSKQKTDHTPLYYDVDVKGTG